MLRSSREALGVDSALIPEISKSRHGHLDAPELGHLDAPELYRPIIWMLQNCIGGAWRLAEDPGDF